MTCIGGGLLPQAEQCRTPFTGTATGAVDIRLATDRFGWGAQGGAMIQLDLALTGEAAALESVAAEIAVRIEGVALPRPRLRLRARCGRIDGVTIALTDQPCEDSPNEVEVAVDVQGVGSVTRTLTLRGGEMTMGRPVCTSG